MKIKILCFVLFITTFSAKAEEVLYVKNYSSDASSTVFNTLNKAKKSNIKKIVFEHGVYNFYPLKAFEKYCAVSNNTNGLKRIAFPIIDFNELEIDGSGSTFIFHDVMVPFCIENSTNITLRNFSIDWNKTFHSESKVIDIDSIKKTFTIGISSEYPYQVQGKELIWLNNNGKRNIEHNLFFDPFTKATVYNVQNYKLDPWNPLIRTRYSAYEIEQGKVCILDTIAQLPQVGWIWISKGQKSESRLSPGIIANTTSGLFMNNINIYHAGAMGIIAEQCKDVFLKNVNVLLPPEKQRFVSTTADATHFVNCKGEIVLDSCIFENMLDDATNVHGVYCKVIEKIDSCTLGLQTGHFEQYGSKYFQKGDSICLLTRNTLSPIIKLKVLDVYYKNEEYCELKFTNNISIPITQEMIVENLTCQPNFTMKNCTVRRNRARSILISSAGKICIKNNYFSSMMSAIVIAGSDANFWYESGGVRNVLIQNNIFENNCTSGHNQACIMIGPNPKRYGVKSGFYFSSNIKIENNTFKSFDNAIIYAYSVENMSFINNVITKTNNFKSLLPNKPFLEFEYCKNVYFYPNIIDSKFNTSILYNGKFDLLNSKKHLMLSN